MDTNNPQQFINNYLKNCRINHIALHELQTIKETLSYLNSNNMLIGNEFITMAFMIRLGSVIENGLREFYMTKMNIETISQLKASDKMFQINGIFQRLRSSKKPNITTIFAKLDIEIQANALYKNMQEIMEHRHLYAHNSGFVDDVYITNIKDITGIDIKNKLPGYPATDVLWKQPLNNILLYIDQVDHFLNTLQV